MTIAIDGYWCEVMARSPGVGEWFLGGYWANTPRRIAAIPTGTPRSGPTEAVTHRLHVRLASIRQWGPVTDWSGGSPVMSSPVRGWAVA